MAQDDDDKKKDKHKNKLFGMFTVDPDLAPIFRTVGEGLRPKITAFVQGGSNTAIRDVMIKAGAGEAAASKYARAVAFGLGAGVTFFDNVMDVGNSLSMRMNEMAQLNTDLAPFMAKRGSYYGTSKAASVAPQKNEMIASAKARMMKKLRSEFSADAAQLISKAPQLALQVLHSQIDSKTSFVGERPLADTDVAKLQSLANHIDGIGTGVAGGLGEYASKKLTQGHNEEGNHIALDMVLHLREKIYDQDVEGRKENIPGMDGSSVAIADFVLNIFQQHQKDMGQTPVGKRLEPDLKVASEIIAKAITEGHMDPIALVALVGERQVVQEQGKIVVKKEKLVPILEGLAKDFPSPKPGTAEVYMKESTMKMDELKQIFGTLHGEDRQFFAALFPDEVLKQVGFAEKEILSVRDKVRTHYFQHLHQAVADLNAMSDEQLKAMQLTEDEVKKLREVAQKTKDDGTKAVADADGKLGEDGIERVVANAKGYWVNHAQHHGKVMITPTAGVVVPLDEIAKSVTKEDKKADDKDKPAADEHKGDKAKPAKETEAKAAGEDEGGKDEHRGEDDKAASDADDKDKKEKGKADLVPASHLDRLMQRDAALSGLQRDA